MITSVTYKPLYLGCAYNPIIWSCLSSKINQTDMKYVFDIYVDGVYLNRIKQRPNPAGYGLIDVSTIVQGTIDSNNPLAPITQGETSIEYDNGMMFKDNQYMSKHVYLKVGEEYTLNGVSNIYIGTADQLGEPNYALYSGNTTIATIPVHTWAASITDHESQWSMQDTTASGIFGGNPFNGQVFYDHGMDALSHPLNFNELNQDLYVFDKMVLSWLNWSPYPAQQGRPIFGFRWVITDPNSVVLTYDIPMITSTGYAQRVTCDTVVAAQLDPRFDIVHVLASPDNIKEGLDPAGAWGPIAPGWTIEITGYSRNTEDVEGCTFLNPITETVTINVVEYCEPLYQRVRLSWFNTLGGRDYMNFTMFDEQTTNTTQDMYSQEQMNWSGSTPVPLLNNSNIIKNLGVKGGAKALNKQATITRKIQTDWLTQEQVQLLEGLQKSPQVLAYIHEDNNDLSDYYAYTCSISNASYTTKNTRQAKLVQGIFDITYVISQNLQNL